MGINLIQVHIDIKFVPIYKEKSEPLILLLTFYSFGRFSQLLWVLLFKETHFLLELILLHEENHIGYLIRSQNFSYLVKDVVQHMPFFLNFASKFNQIFSRFFEMVEVTSDFLPNFLKSSSIFLIVHNFTRYLFNFSTPFFVFWRFNLSEKVFTLDCWPKNVSIERGLGKVEEIEIEFAESSFPFFPESPYPIDDWV